MDRDEAKLSILFALAAGASKRAAAGMAGVSFRTLYRWAADDEAFADGLEMAQGRGRGVYEAILREAANKDWRAAVAAYEIVYLNGVKGGARGAADPEPLPALPADVFEGETPEEVEARVGKVLSLLREALRDEDGTKTEEVIESNARRLVDGRRVVS